MIEDQGIDLYAYQVVRGDDEDELSETLSKMGQEGWEPVQAAAYLQNDVPGLFVILRRPLIKPTPPNIRRGTIKPL